MYKHRIFPTTTLSHTHTEGERDILSHTILGLVNLPPREINSVTNTCVYWPGQSSDGHGANKSKDSQYILKTCSYCGASELIAMYLAFKFPHF